MKLVKRLVVAFFIILTPLICSAQVTSVDWKMYGGSTLEEDNLLFFYDSNGILHQKDGYIRVWIKCLLLNDLESFWEKSFKKKGPLFDQLIENLFQKMAKSYVPPYTTIESFTKEELKDIALFEEEANIAPIESKIRILYEINCPEQKSRRLSFSFNEKGKHHSIDKPSDWSFMPPEGNGANLLKLVCQKS